MAIPSTKKVANVAAPEGPDLLVVLVAQKFLTAEQKAALSKLRDQQPSRPPRR